MLCNLAKKLFKAEFVDVRPVSGVVANLVVYSAFAEPGDCMLALSIPSGGHISMGKKRLGGTAGAVRGLEVEYLALDEKELNIDWTLKKFPLKVDEINCYGEKGLTTVFGKKLDPSLEKCKRIWPDQTQGFFICKLKKQDS